MSKEAIGATNQANESGNEIPSRKKVLSLSPEKARELFEKSWDAYLVDCKKFEELHARQMSNPWVAASVSGIGRLG
jgi:hypothetical protein